MEITLEQLDELSIENEKKNQLIREQEQRIRELEAGLWRMGKLWETLGVSIPAVLNEGAYLNAKQLLQERTKRLEK